MISFRQHVVSLVAVFLALAVGVALGGGPLSSAGDRADSAPGSSRDAADGSVDSGVADAEASYVERFAATAGTRLYADGLASSAVAVVAMPDADKDVLKALSVQIRSAGGRVTGRYGIREAMVDPSERTLVDTLSSQLATQLDDSDVDGSAATYVRLGQLLGLGIATTDDSSTAPDSDALTVRESFSGASLMASPSVEVANAPLVLVVLGPEDGLESAGAEARASLLGGLAATTSGVVVLGDATSATAGTLSVLRSQSSPDVLATVDGAAGTLTEVGAVIALVGVLEGRSGAFGPASPDGAVPVG